MKYIQIGVLGAKELKNTAKIVYIYPVRVHAPKFSKMCAKFMLYIECFICFWGQGFQKCDQNFRTLTQCP